MANPWKLPTLPAASLKAANDLSAIPDYFGTGGPEGTKVARAARIPGADPGIYQGFVDAEQLRKTIGSSTSDYFAALSASKPASDQFAESDINELDALFNPMGYQEEFAGIRGRRSNALKNLDQYLFSDMRRALSQGRIGSGGAGGLSSYLARIAASEAGKIRANEAADSATNERTDLASLLAARQGSVGKRTGILDANLARILSSIDVASKGTGAASDAMTRAIQQALLNSIIGVASPE